jgi:hypothetical protein
MRRLAYSTWATQWRAQKVSQLAWMLRLMYAQIESRPTWLLSVNTVSCVLAAYTTQDPGTVLFGQA